MERSTNPTALTAATVTPQNGKTLTKFRRAMITGIARHRSLFPRFLAPAGVKNGIYELNFIQFETFFAQLFEA
ncbi:MAG TPA: hypothetical protein VIS52_03210 [Motiliproteus sp.]